MTSSGEQHEILYLQAWGFNEKVDAQEARWRKQYRYEVAVFVAIVVAGLALPALRLYFCILMAVYAVLAISREIIQRRKFHREMQEITARIRLYEKAYGVQLLPPDEDQ